MFKQPLRGGAVVALFVVCFGLSADAAVVGYTLQLSEDHDAPTLRLTNDAAEARITAFSLTIGDAAFNYDGIDNPSLDGVGGVTLVNPDLDLTGGDRTDTLEFTFLDFDPTESFQADAEIDPDTGEDAADYRQVLFDLDGSDFADNALSTVSFSDGQELSGYLPDFASNDLDAYRFSQSTAIPLPGAGMMGVALLGGLGLVRPGRRRRSA